MPGPQWMTGSAQSKGRREVQADAYAIARADDVGRIAAAVTDGIGDAAESAALAQLAATTAAKATRARDPEHGCQAAREARATQYGAHHRLIGTTNPDASIVTALVSADHSRLRIAWAGLCRAYVMTTAGVLERATYDHSLGEHIRTTSGTGGRHTPWLTYDRKVTRTVARNEFVTAHLPLRDLRRVLLCSDGVHLHLADRAIAAVLRDVSTDPTEAANILARAAGLTGTDNATAVILQRTH